MGVQCAQVVIIGKRIYIAGGVVFEKELEEEEVEEDQWKGEEGDYVDPEIGEEEDDEDLIGLQEEEEVWMDADGEQQHSMKKEEGEDEGWKKVEEEEGGRKINEENGSMKDDEQDEEDWRKDNKEQKDEKESSSTSEEREGSCTTEAKVYEVNEGATSGTRAINKNCVVLVYSMIKGDKQWKSITAPVSFFAMAAVDNQLIIAGGNDPNTNSPSNQVSVLGDDNKTWVKPFPMMSVARALPSAASYKKWVVVLGGMVEECEQNLVELLDTYSEQWYKASPTPGPIARPSLAVVHGTLYIAWKDLFASISIENMISDALSHAQTMSSLPSTSEWQLLPSPLTIMPALVSCNGHLFAVGDFHIPSSTIATYIPYLQKWQKVSELPTQRQGCVICYQQATDKLIVIGGHDEKKNPVFSMDITTC